MAALAVLFFKHVFAGLIDPAKAPEYIAGLILLGVAPCTAMVFVWSQLTKGDPNYTLVQASVNDLIMIVAFAPIVVFLLGVTDISVPWETLILSVFPCIVIPLIAVPPTMATSSPTATEAKAISPLKFEASRITGAKVHQGRGDQERECHRQRQASGGEPDEQRDRRPGTERRQRAQKRRERIGAQARPPAQHGARPFRREVALDPGDCEDQDREQDEDLDHVMDEELTRQAARKGPALWPPSPQRRDR